MLIQSSSGISVLLILFLFIASCDDKDAFEYVNSTSIFGDSTTVDSQSLSIISEAMHSTFLSGQTASIGSTWEVFIDKTKLLEEVDSSKQFLPYFLDLVKSLDDYPEMFDDLNNNNYRSKKSYTRFHGFLNHIQNDEWACLTENYNDNNDLIRAANQLLDNDVLTLVVQPSLPGYSGDGLKAVTFIFYYDLSFASRDANNTVIALFNREDTTEPFQFAGNIFY